MADRAILAEDIIAGLHDIRLPSQAAGGTIADIAAAIGLGLLLALLVGYLTSLITIQKTAPNPPSPQDQIRAFEGLTDEDRVLQLIGLIKAYDPTAPILKDTDLYAQGGLPSIAELEAHLKTLRPLHV